jgi:Raf kinase inhibitor-like YbhB/YbcL family protein
MSMHLGDLQIYSLAFKSLEHIPKHYSAYGDNISPPLNWSKAPRNTREFALICYDPDAPYTYGFTHWVIYGIPPEITGIEEDKGKLFTEGVNSTGKMGYSGPAPPPGNGPHHYYFWLYALDKALALKPGLTRQELLDAIDNHILVQARFIGIYEEL